MAFPGTNKREDSLLVERLISLSRGEQNNAYVAHSCQYGVDA